MTSPCARVEQLLEDINKDEDMAASVTISAIEVKAIGGNESKWDDDDDLPPTIPSDAADVRKVLDEISSLLCDRDLYLGMKARSGLGLFMQSISSMNACMSKFVLNEMK